jgi:hypothetical protein
MCSGSLVGVNVAKGLDREFAHYYNFKILGRQAAVQKGYAGISRFYED